MDKDQQHVSQLEDIFTSLPESVIVCDRDEKILRINAAALKLFEVTSEVDWQGISYQLFLQRYKQQQADIPMQWLIDLITDSEAVSSLVVQMPSGKKACIELFRSPLFDIQKRLEGTIYVLHDITNQYQKAFHIQDVHQAVVTLLEAIAHIPETVTDPLPEEPLLLSAPVLFIDQQLVDVIRRVLSCRAVSLLISDTRGHLFHTVGSGFTPEQEQEMEHLVNEFLNMAAHELRTPLTAIKASSRQCRSAKYPRFWDNLLVYLADCYRTWGIAVGQTAGQVSLQTLFGLVS